MRETSLEIPFTAFHRAGIEVIVDVVYNHTCEGDVHGPTYSFKGIDFRGRVPFVVIILVVLLFSLVTVDPPTVFLIGFLVYAASGPFMKLVKRGQEQG